MSALKLVYWVLVGSLFGIGILSVDVLFVSIPCLLVSIGLALYAERRFGRHDFWIAVAAFGILCTLILTLPSFVGLTASICPMTPNGISYISSPGTSRGGCVPPGFIIMAVFFGVVALLGAGWPLLRRLGRAD
jgi:hypothetical protein